MPHVQVNGAQIYYEEHGTGTPLLLGHGFAGTTAMWEPQVEPLSQRTRLITYDLRGHGQSDAPADPDLYSADIAVADLYGLLSHLGVERGVIGGLSLGGVLALRFYLAHPEMVQALILADTGPGFRNPEAMARWNETCDDRARILESGGMAAFAATPYGESDYYTKPEIMARLNPIGLANVSRKVMSQFDARVIEVLPNIKVPTLILCGEQDTDFLVATDYMGKKIPNAQVVMIPNAGHGANVDQPEAFNRAILEFLDKHGL